MMSGDKNLKDSEQNSPASYQANNEDMSFIVSHTKTNKLVTALYMVTDIIDKEEPIRNKLRTLGAGIISDIHSTNTHSIASNKIHEIMSFLDIAFAIGLISQMNCNILQKEFMELNQSIKDSIDKVRAINRQINLSEFFSTPANAPSFDLLEKSKGHIETLKGHSSSTRIGVQKGSTLMKALSDKTNFFSHKNYSRNKDDLFTNISRAEGFDVVKKHRRDSIINIIKNNGGNSTIKDIMVKTNTGVRGSFTCSEKTLQRELMSMIKDGVLYKTGEKRWSKYFIKN